MDAEPVKKMHLQSLCFQMCSSFQIISRKISGRNHCCESDILPLCLSFLVPFGGSLIALCKGLGAAAAVEQMALRVFCTPGTDDNKTLWGKNKEFVTPAVTVSPFLRYTCHFLWNKKRGLIMCLEIRIAHVSLRGLYPPRQGESTMSAHAHWCRR